MGIRSLGVLLLAAIVILAPAWGLDEAVACHEQQQAHDDRIVMEPNSTSTSACTVRRSYLSRAWGKGLSSVIGTSCVSFAGAGVMVLQEKHRNAVAEPLVALATGAILGNLVFTLLPYSFSGAHGDGSSGGHHRHRRLQHHSHDDNGHHDGHHSEVDDDGGESTADDDDDRIEIASGVMPSTDGVGFLLLTGVFVFYWADTYMRRLAFRTNYLVVEMKPPSVVVPDGDLESDSSDHNSPSADAASTSPDAVAASPARATAAVALASPDEDAPARIEGPLPPASALGPSEGGPDPGMGMPPGMVPVVVPAPTAEDRARGWINLLSDLVVNFVSGMAIAVAFLEVRIYLSRGAHLVVARHIRIAPLHN